MLVLFTVHGQETTEEIEPELHPLDGWFNNLIHPDWGAVGMLLYSL